MFAKRFRQGILEKFPFIKVYLKSDYVDQKEENKATQYMLDPNVPNSNIIEAHKTTVRIGAFEISIARYEGKLKRTTLLFSKLKSKKWPCLPLLLEKISNHLPKTNLVVNLFDVTKEDAADPKNADDPEFQEKLNRLNRPVSKLCLL